MIDAVAIRKGTSAVVSALKGSTPVWGVVASDSFSGADAATIHGRVMDAGLGGSPLTWVHSSAANGFSILGQQLIREATGSARWVTVEVGIGDVEVSIRIAALPTAGALQLTTRNPESVDTGVRALVSNAGGTWIQVVVAGVVVATGNTFLTNNGLVVPGDVIGLRVVGDDIALIRNGAVIDTITSTAVPPDSTRVGLRTNSPTTGFALDDFTARVPRPIRIDWSAP